MKASLTQATNRKTQIAFLLVFLLAVSLRLSLALVNREAYDDHMPVIELMLNSDRLPLKEDCQECFQPKLYYFVVASLLKSLSIADPEAAIVTAQLVNVLASAIALWVIWLLLRQVTAIADTPKLLAFGLVALNPNLVAINVMATNDTFVISLSTIAFFYAYQFIKNRKSLNLTLTIVFSVLTVLSKTNGIITPIAIATTLFLESIAHRNFLFSWGKGTLFYLSTYIISVFALIVLNPLGQYLQNYQLYGSPLALNMDPQPWPYFFEKTKTARPGITSIQDGFLTFKYIDLLSDPQINLENKDYPAHRTSYWTMLYGRANFIQHTPWPPSWITHDRNIRWLGRIMYSLALLPTTLLIVGAGLEATRLLRSFLDTQSLAAIPFGAGLFLISFLGALGFGIAYALRYRIFTVLKAIFIYPALPSFAILFVVGLQSVSLQINKKTPRLMRLLNASMFLLLGFYTLDIILLFTQLAFPK
jgi:hypothetical protein